MNAPGHAKKLTPSAQGKRINELITSVKSKKGIIMENNNMTSKEGTQTGTEGAGRTFTQEDVNRIVQERLAKEKGKGNEDLDKRAADLDKRERKMNAVQKLRDNNLPDYLVDALNMDTDEAFENSLNAIIKMRGETGENAGKTGRMPGEVIIGCGDPIGTIKKGPRGDDLRSAFGLR